MSSVAPYAETWLEGPCATRFYTRTYTPTGTAKAVIVFIHGFAEHVGRYTHFHPILAERGIGVFALDQRGFGLTAQDTSGKKSPSSAYGKTTWVEQMKDIAWAVDHAKSTFTGIPIFLMGHSMGGAEVLGFASQGNNSSYSAHISALAGVISTSPLIRQTTPAPKLMKWIGGKLSILAPTMLIPAEVVPSDLSHDNAANDAYMKDPLIKRSGSLRGIHDMFTQGEALLKSYHLQWPKSLSLLLVHGTGDKVTSHIASQQFHDKIVADTKKIILIPDGFHELQHEPNGVKEQLAEEVISFVESRLQQKTNPQSDANAPASKM